MPGLSQPSLPVPVLVTAKSRHPMCLPAPLTVPVAAHEPDRHPRLVVVGLVDPTACLAWGHLHNLVKLGAPLVDPVGSRSSVLTLVLILYPCL